MWIEWDKKKDFPSLVCHEYCSPQGSPGSFPVSQSVPHKNSPQPYLLSTGLWGYFHGNEHICSSSGVRANFHHLPLPHGLRRAPTFLSNLMLSSPFLPWLSKLLLISLQTQHHFKTNSPVNWNSGVHHGQDCSSLYGVQVCHSRPQTKDHLSQEEFDF